MIVEGIWIAAQLRSDLELRHLLTLRPSIRPSLSLAPSAATNYKKIAFREATLRKWRTMDRKRYRSDPRCNCRNKTNRKEELLQFIDSFVNILQDHMSGCSNVLQNCTTKQKMEAVYFETSNQSLTNGKLWRIHRSWQETAPLLPCVRKQFSRRKEGEDYFLKELSSHAPKNC